MKGRKTILVAGIAATAILLAFLALSDEVRVQFYLYRLRSSPSEYLGSMVNSVEGSVERKAVTRFVATVPGRHKLLSLVMNALLEDWGRPRGRGINKPRFQDLAHALCGMRLQPSTNQWVLWAETRLPPPRSWSQSTTAVRPAFASGAALFDALRAMCRETDPGEHIVLTEYPGLGLTIYPFEEGLDRYEAALRAQGNSIEEGLFWNEILCSWKELLRSESLLPWVVHVKSLNR